MKTGRTQKNIIRPGVRSGYDLWADTYDATPNPLVALDRMYALPALRPVRGERILDAGCGTGYHLPGLASAGATAVGLDFSRNMLLRARSLQPATPLVQADLHDGLPFRDRTFDSVLSSLVSEHLRDIGAFCREVFRVLRPGGRFVWTVFHPTLAAGGVEANFAAGNDEVRLGAEQHTEDDYRGALTAAGLTIASDTTYSGTPELAKKLERAAKYVGRPLLIVYVASKG